MGLQRQVQTYQPLADISPYQLDSLEEAATSAFSLSTQTKFRFRKMEEASRLGYFLSYAFPEPARARLGLTELLINAVEHGIYGLGYEAKSALLKERAWLRVLQERERDLRYAGRWAEVRLLLMGSYTAVAITDPGDGFNWKPYLSFDTARAQDWHGRGIAQAASISFDKLEYAEPGNCVTGFVRNSQ